MDNIHEKITSIYNHRIWAVYTILYKLYDNPNIKITECDYCSWEELLDNKGHCWRVDKKMHEFIKMFKDQCLNDVSKEEFEAFALCKIFLQAMLDDNIRRLSLMCYNFENVNLFLQSIGYLYQQKFNISKIQFLFHPIFFDIIGNVPENMIVDIAYILSTRKSDKPIVIKIKKLQPFCNYINAQKLISEEAHIINILKYHFNCDRILKVKEFHMLCKTFYEYSISITTQKRLKEFSKNEIIKKFINNLNKDWGNILLLALFNKKEDGIVYHKTLYQDLENVHRSAILLSEM